METVLETEQLTRRFGPLTAVDGLTLQVRQGEVFGLLGPNGAGKTTTVRLLNGVLAPSTGRVRVLGLDPARQGTALRLQTGVLTETPSLYERLSARENLSIFGALYGVEQPGLGQRVDELLAFFGLSARAGDRVGGFSKGMLQRLALARALLHRPALLFLDEPTAALDPEAARQVTDLIGELSRQEGRTVLLCTHNLAEAQQLCDRVGVLAHGRLLAEGALAELSRTLFRGLWADLELGAPPEDAALAGLRSLTGVRDVQQPDPLRLAVQVQEQALVPAVVALLVQAGAQVMRVNPRQYSLEDVYFELQRQEHGSTPAAAVASAAEASRGFQ